MAHDGEPVPVRGQLGPLPWQLNAPAKKIVNARVVNVSYPHWTPVCSIGNESFIYKSGCWRNASKLIAFLVLLVPVLRGFVAPFRTGLRFLVWGLRILEGQTYSVNDSTRFGFQHCKAFKKTDLQLARTLIILGLAMIEGCVPVAVLVPAIHCLCHYPDGALKWGILRLLWMMSFGKIVHLGACASR